MAQTIKVYALGSDGTNGTECSIFTSEIDLYTALADMICSKDEHVTAMAFVASSDIDGLKDYLTDEVSAPEFFTYCIDEKEINLHGPAIVDQHEAEVAAAERSTRIEAGYNDNAPFVAFTLPDVDSLPPDADADGMNQQRADAALSAITHFAVEFGEALDEDGILEQNAMDLLGDIMHLCDRADFSFDNILRKARAHYNEEVQSA